MCAGQAMRLQKGRTESYKYYKPTYLAVDPSCKPCQKEPDDREHFVARGDSMEHVRN